MPYADPERQRAYQREWAARNRAEYLADKVCIDCGSIKRLEVDHVDPRLKVSHRIWTWSRTRREAELAKCVVRCFPCHRYKTWLLDEAQPKSDHGQASMVRKGCKCELCRAYAREMKRRQRAGIRSR